MVALPASQGAKLWIQLQIVLLYILVIAAAGNSQEDQENLTDSIFKSNQIEKSVFKALKAVFTHNTCLVGERNHLY